LAGRRQGDGRQDNGDGGDQGESRHDDVLNGRESPDDGKGKMLWFGEL